MISFLWSLGAFVLALGILVAVHEWGHFWVARRCGVKVEKFSIGFGKALWRRTDKLGTEYVIAAIPLGGYVRMLDERVDQVAEKDLPQAFNRQPVLKRIAIIAAGPLTNFIFAVFALLLMYLLGLPTVKPIVGAVSDNSIAAAAGLPSNVQIMQVAQRDTADWEAVNFELIAHIGEASLPLTVAVAEGGQRQFNLDISRWQFDPDQQSALASLGIMPFRPAATKELAYVSKDSAAAKAGLLVGDKIVSLDGTIPQNWEQIVEYVSARAQQAVVLEIERDKQIQLVTVTIGHRQQQGQKQGYLGVSPKFEPWPQSYLFTHQYGPIDGIFKALDKTWRLITLSVDMIGKLITGDLSVKNLSGPISIAQGAGASAGYGLVYFLSFLALISVNLGIINLLPLPMLDGGHLLYYFIELLTGRPVPESVQEVGVKIGGILLLLLMTVAIVNDIARLS